MKKKSEIYGAPNDHNMERLNIRKQKQATKAAVTPGGKKAPATPVSYAVKSAKRKGLKGY